MTFAQISFRYQDLGVTYKLGHGCNKELLLCVRPMETQVSV